MQQILREASAYDYFIHRGRVDIAEQDIRLRQPGLCTATNPEHRCMQIESAPFGKQCRHISARQVQRNLAAAEIVNRDMLTGKLAFPIALREGQPGPVA